MMASEDNERLEAIKRAAHKWRERLMADQARSPLMYFRDLKRSTLDLSPQINSVDSGALNRLLSGEKTRLSAVFTDSDILEDANLRATTISRSAAQLREDKGIDALYIAIGLATWHVDSGADYHAPVGLIPLSITTQGRARRDFELQTFPEDADVNRLLIQRLQADFQIGTDNTQDKFSNALSEQDPLSTLRGQISDLEEQWSDVTELEIEWRLVIGIFKYANLPMVNDLGEDNLGELAESVFLAAMAGWEPAIRTLQHEIGDPPPLNRPDIAPPRSEFLVLDADSSQSQAINWVLAGGSLVIQGPPGTGKSQTIANLISSLIAEGKHVLFVAQKRAAIDVVKQRLESVGLGDLVLDVHGGFSSRREFWQEIKTSLTVHGQTLSANDDGLADKLVVARNTLLEHDTMLHGERPWGLTLYQLQVRMHEIDVLARTSVRLAWQMPQKKHVDDVREIEKRVVEYVGLGGMSLASDHPEWHSSEIRTADDAEQTWQAASDLAAVVPRIEEILEQHGFQSSGTLFDWRYLDVLLREVAGFTERHGERIFELALNRELANDLKPARQTLPQALARMFSSRYQRALKHVQSLSKDPDKLSGSQVLEVVEEVNRVVSKWREVNYRSETLPRALPGLAAEIQGALQKSDQLENGLGRDFSAYRLDDIKDMCARLSRTRSTVASLPRIKELEEYFGQQDITGFLREITADVPNELAADALEWAWLTALTNSLEFQDSALTKFAAAVLENGRKSFIEHDSKHISATPARIRRIVAEASIDAMNRNPTDRGIVQREAGKMRRHMSPRRALQGSAYDVLIALRPAWMISPLMVAEMLPAKHDLFDVVIFDEASQIPPEEAIGSLARAQQVVVAGDDKQLPPTDFFRRSQMDDLDEEDEDEDGAATSIDDYESILDVFSNTLPLRKQMLGWHYRSRDSRLIAFSNEHLYGGSLTTFPGTVQESPLSHHTIEHRTIPGINPRSNSTNPDEVARVVEIILEHARARQTESLGVIAFGQRHAEQIQEAIDNHRSNALRDERTEEFFEGRAVEPFFIKNIERVQGDERDVIILSVGYRRNNDGRLLYNFGALNNRGGERRLNVAITRARSHLHLVSSFSHVDMDPGRSSAKGVELLRHYFEYVSSGGVILESKHGEHSLNAFEVDVKTGLDERNIPFTPQYGSAGYRIDFALAHPERPGQFVLALEADGDSYHRMPTVRDRDRLRQRVLEDKGWKFYRLSSTAWTRDRQGELDKIEQAWRAAVTLTDSGATPAKGEPPADVSNRPSANPFGRKGPRPNVRRRDKIDEYSDREIESLIDWIDSDGRLRDHDELKRLLVHELGFARRGKRIDERLSAILLRRERRT